MKLLLDTHIWVWSVADDSRLTGVMAVKPRRASGSRRWSR